MTRLPIDHVRTREESESGHFGHVSPLATASSFGRHSRERDLIETTRFKGVSFILDAMREEHRQTSEFAPWIRV